MAWEHVIRRVRQNFIDRQTVGETIHMVIEDMLHSQKSKVLDGLLRNMIVSNQIEHIHSRKSFAPHHLKDLVTKFGLAECCTQTNHQACKQTTWMLVGVVGRQPTARNSLTNSFLGKSRIRVFPGRQEILLTPLLG